MNMKRILPIAALSLLILSACTQLPTDPYTGSYTFKTSGTVTVVVSADVSDEDPVKLEPKVYDLTTEVGRMDIKARGNDTMLVTMNVLGGDVYVFDAELTPGGFRLLPSTRTLRVGTLPDFQVTVSGEAFILDGLLNVNLVYSGSRTVLPSINYTITDCNVVCVASKN